MNLFDIVVQNYYSSLKMCFENARISKVSRLILQQQTFSVPKYVFSYWTKLFRRKDIAHRDTATKCLDIVSKLNRPIIIKKVSPTKVTRKFYQASVTILAEMWDLFDISRMEDRSIQTS